MNLNLSSKGIVFSILVVLAGCALQPFKPIETTKIVEIPGKDKKAIYTKTRQWFSQYFVSGKTVVDYEDPEAGTIIGNGIAEIGTDPFGVIKYKIKYNIRIDTKDEKLRAVTTITEHTNTDPNETYTVNNVSQERNEKAVKQVGKIVADIENYLKSEKIDSNADW